jgi:hypothetical protein
VPVTPVTPRHTPSHGTSHVTPCEGVTLSRHVTPPLKGVTGVTCDTQGSWPVNKANHATLGTGPTLAPRTNTRATARIFSSLPQPSPSLVLASSHAREAAQCHDIDSHNRVSEADIINQESDA